MDIFQYSVETDDILSALNEIHSSVADAMGTPKVPEYDSVSDDVLHESSVSCARC